MIENKDLRGLVDRLDALGADLNRWPEREAEAARALLARSPAARDAHAEARNLDDLVARAAEAPVPNGFAFRVVADVASRRTDKLSWIMGSPSRFGLAGASFCVAALALGVALGAAVGPAHAGGGTALDLGAAFEVSLSDGDL